MEGGGSDWGEDRRNEKREASFDGPRVPGLPRDLTLTESQKQKRKGEARLKRYDERAERRGGKGEQESRRESRRCRQKCKISLLPVGNSDRHFFSVAAIDVALVMKNYI